MHCVTISGSTLRRMCRRRMAPSVRPTLRAASTQVCPASPTAPARAMRCRALGQRLLHAAGLAFGDGGREGDEGKPGDPQAHLPASSMHSIAQTAAPRNRGGRRSTAAKRRARPLEGPREPVPERDPAGGTARGDAATRPRARRPLRLCARRRHLKRFSGARSARLPPSRRAEASLAHRGTIGDACCFADRASRPWPTTPGAVRRRGISARSCSR